MDEVNGQKIHFGLGVRIWVEEPKIPILTNGDFFRLFVRTQGDGSIVLAKARKYAILFSGDENATTSEKEKRKRNISYNAQRNQWTDNF